jgi:hypothetical protein
MPDREAAEVNGLRKFLRLSPARRGLLLRAGLLVGLVRVALWLVAFPSLLRLVARLSRVRAEPPPGPAAEHVAWAVATASRAVPQATCLTQALAARILLATQGHASRLHLAVRKEPGVSLAAHALVECQGRIILGGPAAGFTTIAVL